VPYGDAGATYRTVGSPFTFSASSMKVRRGAPRAGQHTEAFRQRTIWKE
jgi:crotonobetainyl-CoA:carnitine CoA-transferase CaiB-like acyl-CoA transferase